jgi:hypothetical protein
VCLRTWRTHDCAHPLVQVIAFRSSAAVRRWFQTDFCELLLDALGRRTHSRLAHLLFLSFFLSSFSSFSIFTCEKSLPLCVRTRVLCVSLFDYSHKLLPASVLSFETIATLLSKASLNQFHRVFSVLRFTRRE